MAPSESTTITRRRNLDGDFHVLGQPAGLPHHAGQPVPPAREGTGACDAAKNGVARISGLEAPKFEDNEATFDELRARIAKTLAWLDTVPPEKLNGTEDKDITFPVGRESTRTMKGEAYLKHWVLPNLFFHITTAYAILRHNGVEVGKRDYLGALSFR
jgi:hypothetical protein